MAELSRVTDDPKCGVVIENFCNVTIGSLVADELRNQAIWQCIFILFNDYHGIGQYLHAN